VVLFAGSLSLRGVRGGAEVTVGWRRVSSAARLSGLKPHSKQCSYRSAESAAPPKIKPERSVIEIGYEDTHSVGGGRNLGSSDGVEVSGQELFCLTFEFDEHDAVAELGMAGDDDCLDDDGAGVEPEGGSNADAD
jgi:hypothetical protein